jgi:hypothetical protein
MVCFRREQTKGDGRGTNQLVKQIRGTRCCNASFVEHMISYDFARNILGEGLSVIEQAIEASMVDLF